jgi:hypothetical protein
MSSFHTQMPKLLKKFSIGGAGAADIYLFLNDDA